MKFRPLNYTRGQGVVFLCWRRCKQVRFSFFNTFLYNDIVNTCNSFVSDIEEENMLKFFEAIGVNTTDKSFGVIGFGFVNVKLFHVLPPKMTFDKEPYKIDGQHTEKNGNDVEEENQNGAEG